MLHKTDYGLVYNDDGSLCVTHQKDGAVAVEEGTTNLVDFDVVFRSWSSNSSNMASLTKKTGRHSFRVQGTSTVPGAYSYIYPAYATTNVLHSASAWVRNLNSKPLQVRLRIRDGSNGDPLSDNVVVVVPPGQELPIRVTSYSPVSLNQVTVAWSVYSDPDDGTVDAEIYMCQLEAKLFATSFVDGTRPDGILAYPIALKDDYTIVCYRKSHTDEDYKHIVKRSDGKVFVDGVEDSEYDVGWIAGRNLVLNSATEHTFTNTIFNKPLRLDTFQELIGEKLTLSFEAKAEAVGQKMDWYLRNVSAAAIISGTQHSAIELSAEYTRFSYTITLPDISNVTNLSFAFRATSGVSPVTGPVYVKNIKIERGSTATHWTPAPEDLGYDGDVLMLSNHTGHIKDLKILPYIATDKEIKQMYSGGTFGVTHKGIVIADNYSEVGPMNGIIAWWPLDGHTDDYSGNNNHATNNGATITSGIRGSAYNFDGSSSYIRANNVLSQGSPFSISFWTKVFGTSNQCLGCSRTATGNGMSIFIISNKIRFDTDHQWTTGYTVPRNEWIHVVLMQDTSGKKLYINGELEDSTSSVGSMSNLSSIFQIGASHSNGSSLGNYLNGVVSDYRIYNRALSPEEVKILYNATKPDPVPMQISNNGIVYLAGELKEV